MLTKASAVKILKTIKDPELNIDIYTLGLIYRLEVTHKKVDIEMTLTTPFCPYGPAMIDQVKTAFKKSGFDEPCIKLVFTPLWQPSDELRALLGT